MQKSLEAYQFKAGEVIASIGAGGGIWEIGFATFHENLTFFIQDINPLFLNQEEIDAGISYYEKLTKKPVSGQFIPVIGDEKNTNLPSGIFDKVLIINSFHEFTQPLEILKEIRRILKPRGFLFIDESLAKVPGELHEGCNMRLFTEAELIDFVQKSNFSLHKITERESFVKIFAFSS